MRILNREIFLSINDPVLYVKCDQYGNAQGELSISYGRSSKGSNDFVTIPLHGFIKKWNSGYGFDDPCDGFKILEECIKNKDKHFEWDYTMTGRDGLFDVDQLFMIYEQLDLLKLIRELNKIYDYQYHKDDFKHYEI